MVDRVLYFRWLLIAVAMNSVVDPTRISQRGEAPTPEGGTVLFLDKMFAKTA